MPNTPMPTPDAECIHLLTIDSCDLCGGSPKGRLARQREINEKAAAQRKAQRVIVNKDARVRPVNPDEWTKDEWLPVQRELLRELRKENRGAYPGRTCGPKDLSIKPINRTRR